MDYRSGNDSLSGAVMAVANGEGPGGGGGGGGGGGIRVTVKAGWVDEEKGSEKGRLKSGLLLLLLL